MASSPSSTAAWRAAGRRTRFAIAQRVGDFLLALRQRGRFRERAIERVQRFLTPRAGE